MKKLFEILLLAGSLVLSPTIALSQSISNKEKSIIDPHDWIINEPRYVNNGGTHCCSMKHCKKILMSEITPVKNGYMHKRTGTVLYFNTPGIYLSKTEEPWACIWDYEELGESMECLFLPGNM